MRLCQILAAALPSLALSCLPQSASAITLAFDEASSSAYTDGWQAGDNGGSGFGPWQLDFSGDDTGLVHAPQFIDLGPLAGNSLGAPAFGLTTSDRVLLRDTSEARRTFNSPLAIGHTFSMDVDGSMLSPGSTTFMNGNTIQFFGSDGLERFGLFTNNEFNNNNWSVGDIDTGIPAENSFHFEFALATIDTYDLTISPLGGGAPLFAQIGAPLTGTAGAAINSIRISAYGTGSSLGGSKEMFFDNLMVVGDDNVAGDYNRNGTVDAADYVVWRDTLGEAGAALAADGNANSRIDTGDYDIWKANFGSMSSAFGGRVASVPEPVALSAWILALHCLSVSRLVDR